jgi:phage shock protein A
MPDTVEDIDRQIQELIQQKKLVSNAQNLNGSSSSHSTVVKASSQGTTSKGQFARATRKVEKRADRGHFGQQGIENFEGTHTKLASQEVCKPQVLERLSKIGSLGVN